MRALTLVLAALTFACSSGTTTGDDGGTGDDDGGQASDSQQEAQAPAIKRVFVTSIGYAPNWGGPEKADTLCTNVANGAGLGGKWVAWVSIGAPNVPDVPIDRITQYGANPNAGPWYLVDQTTKVFANVGALSGAPLVPINQDESGGAVPPLTGAWTGTLVGGTASTDDCSGWSTTFSPTTATVGTPAYNGADKKPADWTEGNAAASIQDQQFSYCNDKHSLICFEQ
ncbi:MAG TPA: hypothetical protein VGH28_13130 [Polyangiaceae bacterium]|jgi:hypothetical protein